MMEPEPATAEDWLVRIPPIFDPIAPDVLDGIGAQTSKRLGPDFYLIKTSTSEKIRGSDLSKFVRWSLPVGHAWPCNPQKMDSFIEKVSQMLQQKFQDLGPQGVFVGRLDPGSPGHYYKHLATNLRGRVSQLFPDATAGTVLDQLPERPSLFCLVGKQGVYCGMASPQQANGFYPGGDFFVGKNTSDTISRAGGKIAEALHYLLLHRPELNEGLHWIELGACPGGMTSELLRRNHRVTAIDRAPLDPRIAKRTGLRFVLADCADFEPDPASTYHAILSDLNGPPEESIRHVIRLAPCLEKPGLVVFTLKVPKVENVQRPLGLFEKIVRVAEQGGLKLFAHTHLASNRHEFTLFFEVAEH